MTKKRDRSPPSSTSGTRGTQMESVAISDVLTTSAMLQRTRPLAPVPRIPPNKVGTLEMYKRFPQEYDLLMQHHDCSLVETALGNMLHDVAATHEGQPLLVADLGCGTGRILSMVLRQAAAARLQLGLLCGYDKEGMMLKAAAANLGCIGGHGGRSATVRLVDRAEVYEPDSGAVSICLRPFDFQHVRDGALQAPHPKLHVMTCAWSLSYVMRACWGGDRWHGHLRDTIEAMKAAVVDGGVIVIIETMGNGCESPTRRNTMMDFLEEAFGFQRMWVRTDYTFPSLVEGEAMCKFFFAHGVSEAFRERGALVLPECTGLWTLTVRHTAAHTSSQLEPVDVTMAPPLHSP